MVFHPPAWLPEFPDPPSDISIDEFMLDEKHGRQSISSSRNPYTCGLTGKTYTFGQVEQRVDALARGIGRELAFQVNEGTEFDKVVAQFCINTIDLMTLAWATHRLNGILSPANSQYSQVELEYQLRNSGAQCLFTCLPLLQTAKAACKTVGIPDSRIFLLNVPATLVSDPQAGKGYKTLDDLIDQGEKQPTLPKKKWSPDEGKHRTAFLCYSSGTSGLPKGVMISHRNVIANTLQMAAFESRWRKQQRESGSNVYLENALGLLPMSHMYAMQVIGHLAPFRGDGSIILPKFEMGSFLDAVVRYQIQTLYLVPPIMILLAKTPGITEKYDLSKVKCVWTGAAPLGEETADDLMKRFPTWSIRQAYGMTETATVATVTDPADVWLGSCGNLMPGYEARLMTIEGNEITGYDQPGELWLKSPTVTLGYLNNAKATREAFVDGYMRTGDEAVVRKNPKTGYEHIFITDRIKELIKVKGLQVAPAELEAHLLTHPAVNDCVVVGVPDDRRGEVPKAFVVKSPQVGLEESEAGLKRAISKHVQDHKARHKWLAGGVEFIDVVPKSPSGKILRRLVRDKDREKRRAAGAKL